MGEYYLLVYNTQLNLAISEYCSFGDCEIGLHLYDDSYHWVFIADEKYFCQEPEILDRIAESIEEMIDAVESEGSGYGIRIPGTDIYLEIEDSNLKISGAGGKTIYISYNMLEPTVKWLKWAKDKVYNMVCQGS